MAEYNFGYNKYDVENVEWGHVNVLVIEMSLNDDISSNFELENPFSYVHLGDWLSFLDDEEKKSIMFSGCIRYGGTILLREEGQYTFNTGRSVFDPYPRVERNKFSIPKEIFETKMREIIDNECDKLLYKKIMLPKDQIPKEMFDHFMQEILNTSH